MNRCLPYYVQFLLAIMLFGKDCKMWFFQTLFLFYLFCLNYFQRMKSDPFYYPILSLLEVISNINWVVSTIVKTGWSNKRYCLHIFSFSESHTKNGFIHIFAAFLKHFNCSHISSSISFHVLMSKTKKHFVELRSLVGSLVVHSCEKLKSQWRWHVSCFSIYAAHRMRTQS